MLATPLLRPPAGVPGQRRSRVPVAPRTQPGLSRPTRPAAAPRTCPSAHPTTLNDAEASALAAFQSAGGVADASARAVSILRQAGTTRDADGDAVLGALAHALTAPTPLPGARPATPDTLSGAPWRLVYSSPAPIPAWRYIPVPEFFTVPPAPVSLSSDVGPVVFNFSGSGQWQPSPSGPAADAALDFSFSRVDVQWGRDAAGPFFTRALGPRPPKTYRFFALLPGGGGGGGGVDVVGARSSGGALSLLARPAGGGGGR